MPEQNMYAFLPRFPIDHVLTLVKNIRSGDYTRGENLILVGAISGELGALMQAGPIMAVSLDAETPSTIAGCCDALDGISFADEQLAAAIPPSVWIPIVLKLIELWLARKGQ